MIIKSLNDKVILEKKEDLLKLHLYLKLLQFNIKTADNDIDIIIELYKPGGYSTQEEQSNFIKHCISMNLRKSEQSLRNKLSEYVTKGVLIKPKNCSLFLREDFIPVINFDKLVIQYTLTHAK